MKNKSKKLFVLGGHITPALAVIDELKRMHPDAELILIGRNSLEERFARTKKIRFLWSSAARLSSPLQVIEGCIQAFLYCFQEKPDLVVSFGGYVAFPVCIAAWTMGIPIITHEQTRVPGRANRIIAKIARRICVTFEETATEFPPSKTVITGLPIRKELLSQPRTLPIPIKENRPIIYITGGSTGAQSLNEIIFPIIPELSLHYIIVHQTGIPSLAKANEIKNDYYIARDFFDVNTVSWILHKAQLVIARSGANTVVELAIFNKRAIFIPLPWSGAGEQLENARWLEAKGLAKILDQKTLTPKALQVAIEEEMKMPSKTKDIHTTPTDGARRMVQVMDAILG